MTFREFLKMDELVGQYGEPKTHSGPLQLIQARTKMVKVPKNRISQMMSAGGPTSPARPVKVSSVHGPLTSPTVLK
jgi:hypothetical protein